MTAAMSNDTPVNWGTGGVHHRGILNTASARFMWRSRSALSSPPSTPSPTSTSSCTPGSIMSASSRMGVAAARTDRYTGMSTSDASGSTCVVMCCSSSASRGDSSHHSGVAARYSPSLTSAAYPLPAASATRPSALCSTALSLAGSPSTCGPGSMRLGTMASRSIRWSMSGSPRIFLRSASIWPTVLSSMARAPTSSRMQSYTTWSSVCSACGDTSRLLVASTNMRWLSNLL
mmetsp:Transcript_28144/g.71753  ORF Transcript_28144/g.71753 Transcript_28144/m.71753 type:complete len:232 (-) Transcript_28144:155-850(-)